MPACAPTRESLQLAGLFDFLEDVVVWIKDRKGCYCWVNRAFLLNYAVENPQGRSLESVHQVLGKTDYDLSPAFLADQFRLDDEQVLAGVRIVNRIELVGQSAGLTSWNVTNKIPLFGAKGKIVGTAGLTRRLGESDRDVVSAAGFGPVLAHMRDHYSASITNQQLAWLSHMSVRAFERKFLGNFHLTPQRYLRKLRMRMASRALVHTSQPLLEVALGCGFSDQSHFSREFRRFFGRTPREYRAHYVKGPAVSGINSAAPTQ